MNAYPHRDDFSNLKFYTWATFLVKYAAESGMSRYTVIINANAIVMEAMHAVVIPPERFLYKREKYNPDGVRLTTAIRCPEHICAMLARHRTTALEKGDPYTTWTPEFREFFSRPTLPIEGEVVSPLYRIKARTRFFTSAVNLPVFRIQDPTLFDPFADLVDFSFMRPSGSEWIYIRAVFVLHTNRRTYTLTAKNKPCLCHD